jgi:hypothetical protein
MARVTFDVDLSQNEIAHVELDDMSPAELRSLGHLVELADGRAIGLVIDLSSVTPDADHDLARFADLLREVGAAGLRAAVVADDEDLRLRLVLGGIPTHAPVVHRVADAEAVVGACRAAA